MTNNLTNMILNLTNVTLAPSVALTYEDSILILKLRHIVFGWILLPIALIGLVLNSFTIVVLLHNRMKNFSTNMYLTALSIANIVCLMNYIFLYSFRYIISYKHFKQVLFKAYNSNIPMKYTVYLNGIYYENFLNMILWAWSPVFLTFQLYSIYLTCAVTVDRWIYLLFPLKADRICTKKRTIIVIISILVFCIIFNLTRWFEVTYDRKFDQHSNITFYYAKKTRFGENKLVNTILSNYVFVISVYVIPFCVLLIANIGIIQKLILMKKNKRRLLGFNNNTSNNDSKRRAQSIAIVEPSKRESINITIGNSNGNSHGLVTSPLLKKASTISTNTQINTSSKIDPKITFMVLAVVISFFICQFPYLILYVINVQKETRFKHIFKIFGDLLATINCCINFLIYCLFSPKFRQTTDEILFNRKPNQTFKPPNNTSKKNSMFTTQI